MNPLPNNRWLHRFAVLTALATLALIGIGGLVTSHEAGMSVPDWPTSYGYNMFFFPLNKWWHGGNIFYEHSHRLFASGVGFLTTILMVWLWMKEPRKWMKWLGVAAFLAVVLQGVLGGSARDFVQGPDRHFPRHARAIVLRADLRHCAVHEQMVDERRKSEIRNRQHAIRTTQHAKLFIVTTTF